MNKKKTFTTTITNAIDPAAPMSVWRKGCAGKGGSTTNSVIINSKTNAKEND